MSSTSSQNLRDNVEVVPPAFFGFTRSPADLRQRIAARIDKMFQRGLVEETRRLLDCGLAQNQTAMQAIGYRQIVEHLRGERSLPETIELIKIRTSQFAKRQMTWFRRHAEVTWMNLEPDDCAATVANRMRSKPELRLQPRPSQPL